MILAEIAQYDGETRRRWIATIENYRIGGRCILDDSEECGILALWNPACRDFNVCDSAVLSSIIEYPQFHYHQVVCYYVVHSC